MRWLSFIVCRVWHKFCGRNSRRWLHVLVLVLHEHFLSDLGNKADDGKPDVLRIIRGVKIAL